MIELNEQPGEQQTTDTFTFNKQDFKFVSTIPVGWPEKVIIMKILQKKKQHEALAEESDG